MKVGFFGWLLCVLCVDGCEAFSRLSSFAGTRTTSIAPIAANGNHQLLVMYDSEQKKRGALDSTERWISSILGKPDKNNPYTRKEVTYVCDMSRDDALVLAGVWRRLREAREAGYQHSRVQIQEASQKTFRRTQVVVFSNHERLARSFAFFDQLIKAVSDARRSSRHFVTDLSLEQNMEIPKDEQDWLVSVNCAHLHPMFGQKTSEQVLREMQEEDEAGEVDVNLQEYKKKRELARRSPFPTLVVEVLSTPPPTGLPVGTGVSSEDVRKLEALLGKPSKRSNNDEEDALFDAVANRLPELTLRSPLSMAQHWVAQHDAAFDANTSTFTWCETQHVDAAYEFAFCNVAMNMPRQYLVYSSLMSNSATSFAQFAQQVKNMMHILPNANHVEILTYHPEHIDPARQSPVPILILASKPTQSWS